MYCLIISVMSICCSSFFVRTILSSKYYPELKVIVGVLLAIQFAAFIFQAIVILFKPRKPRKPKSAISGEMYIENDSQCCYVIFNDENSLQKLKNGQSVSFKVHRENDSHG